jgi:hypothetical protein
VRGKRGCTRCRNGPCTDIQPAASPCGDWDTWWRILKTKGIGEQAENVSVLVSGGRTGGCRTEGGYLKIGKWMS